MFTAKPPEPRTGPGNSGHFFKIFINENLEINIILTVGRG